MNGMTRGNWIVVLVVIVAASIVLFVQLDAVPRPMPPTPTPAPTAIVETCFENIAVVMTGTSESGVTKPVQITVRAAVPCGK